QVLAACGWQINTAFVERLNLSLRQHVAAIGRRVSTLCKGEEGLRQQVAVYHVYYNFCLPHSSLRQALPLPLPTNGTGSAKHWRPQTPAMAGSCTSRVRVMRRDLSSPVHAPSTRRSSLLLSGSQGLGQAVALPVEMPGLLPPER